MSSQVLDTEWCLDGTKIHNVEEKIKTLLEFVLEQRLGPANYILLACTGELLHSWNGVPSDDFVRATHFLLSIKHILIFNLFIVGKIFHCRTRLCT
jgi:hypothetical protein